MKERIYKRDNKYRRRKCLDTTDWITIIFVILILGITAITLFLEG